MRRRRQHEETDNAETDTLTESLLGPSDDSAQPSNTQQHAQQQVILFNQFNLAAFLSYVLGFWQSLIGGISAALTASRRAVFNTTRQAQEEPQEALSLLQVERLDALRSRIGVSYDAEDVDHQALLKELWRVTFPDKPFTAFKTPQWKEMGWQGDDPATDFRGAGLFGLQNLIFFAQSSPDAYRRLLEKADGERVQWEYPFAAAGLNLTVMLVEVFSLRTASRAAHNSAGRTFRRLLTVTPSAFEEIYCVAFEELDAQWLVMKADYMQFNTVLKKVRELVETLLCADVLVVDDLRQAMLLRRRA